MTEQPHVIHNQIFCDASGQAYRSTTTITGGMEAAPIWGKLYWVTWWGSCKPEDGTFDGFKRIFWRLYVESDE